MRAIYSKLLQPKLTLLTVINEHLCRYTRSDSVEDNIEELIKSARSLKAEYEAQGNGWVRRLNEKLGIMIELVHHFRRGPDQFCSREGQSSLRAAELEWDSIRRDQSALNDERQRQCNRIGKITEHFRAERHRLCQSHLAGRLLSKLDSMDRDRMRQVAGSLDELTDLIVESLGGLSTETCSRPPEGLQPFSYRDAGIALLDGLKSMVGSEEELAVLGRARFANKEEVQERHWKLRELFNRSLVEPCRYFVGELRPEVDQLRQQWSLQKSAGEEVAFEEGLSTGDRRRLLRSWALFNTCRLVEQHRETLLLALLEQVGLFSRDEQALDRRWLEFARLD